MVFFESKNDGTGSLAVVGDGPAPLVECCGLGDGPEGAKVCAAGLKTNSWAFTFNARLLVADAGLSGISVDGGCGPLGIRRLVGSGCGRGQLLRLFGNCPLGGPRGSGPCPSCGP